MEQTRRELRSSRVYRRDVKRRSSPWADASWDANLGRPLGGEEPGKGRGYEVRLGRAAWGGEGTTQQGMREGLVLGQYWVQDTGVVTDGQAYSQGMEVEVVLAVYYCVKVTPKRSGFIQEHPIFPPVWARTLTWQDGQPHGHWLAKVKAVDAPRPSAGSYFPITTVLHLWATGPAQVHSGSGGVSGLLV